MSKEKTAEEKRAEAEVAKVAADLAAKKKAADLAAKKDEASKEAEVVKKTAMKTLPSADKGMKALKAPVGDGERKNSSFPGLDVSIMLCLMVVSITALVFGVLSFFGYWSIMSAGGGMVRGPVVRVVAGESYKVDAFEYKRLEGKLTLVKIWGSGASGSAFCFHFANFGENNLATLVKAEKDGVLDEQSVSFKTADWFRYGTRVYVLCGMPYTYCATDRTFTPKEKVIVLPKPIGGASLEFPPPNLVMDSSE